MQLINTYETDDSLILDLSLARITFLSFEDKKKLKKNLDSSKSLALLSIEEIESFLQRKIVIRSKWDGNENLRMAKIAAHYCSVMDIKIIPHYSNYYPELLRQINNPPFVLFAKGNIDCLVNRGVSVVGTRNLTPAGKKSAFDFAYEAIFDGCNVISGLANGADSYAHKGAIEAIFDAKEKKIQLTNLGKTIAVLPSAIDEIVPYNNKRLAESILNTGGCIISEYEPKCPMANWHFVGRNRIIAGLSPATVVIEAPAGSGALITADFALDFNRDLMFHESAFGDMAQIVADKTEKELDLKFAEGKISKYKRENTVEKFIEAGVPVIKNYYDYCICLTEMPGERNNFSKEEAVQGELFKLG